MNNTHKLIGAAATAIAIIGVTGVIITLLVFVTYGMVLAVPLIETPSNCNSTTIESFEPRMMYIWLVVSGSLMWGSIILGYLLPGTKVKEGNGIENTKPPAMVVVIQLVQISWIIYGLIQIFNQEIFESLKKCDPEAANVMRIICLISLISSVILCLYGLIVYIVICFTVVIPQESSGLEVPHIQNFLDNFASGVIETEDEPVENEIQLV